MTSFHGQFCWYDLMTTDAAAAAEFYAAVIGWSARDSGFTDRSYTVLSAGEIGVGGIMALRPNQFQNGARPGWIGYIAVDDVDAAAARVEAEGGGVHHAAEDIPGIGRFAVVHDPQGAVFMLFHPLDPAMGAPPPAEQTPGRIGWHELQAADREAGFAFYARMFGWKKADAMDMGPMGIYQMFATAEHAVGGMMTKLDAAIPPHWVYYINVDEINAAIERVKSAGGQVINGPHQVPGGSWIAHGTDPQGAMFAMVGPG